MFARISSFNPGKKEKESVGFQVKKNLIQYIAAYLLSEDETRVFSASERG